MKKATGWSKVGVLNGWIQKKDQYMKDHGLPIETTVVPVDQVPGKMDEKCDIELDGKEHVAAIVGIAKLESGKYQIDIRHDTNQGSPGGTTDETILYDPATQLLEGGTWLVGKRVDNFVVECAKPFKEVQEIIAEAKKNAGEGILKDLKPVEEALGRAETSLKDGKIEQAKGEVKNAQAVLAHLSEITTGETKKAIDQARAELDRRFGKHPPDLPK